MGQFSKGKTQDASAEITIKKIFERQFKYEIYEGEVWAWLKDHWEALTGKDTNFLNKWVLEQLSSHFPEQVGGGTINSCIATIKASRLDATKEIKFREEDRLVDESLIVPCKGKWLRLVETSHKGLNFKLQVIEPVPEFFVTYTLNIDLTSKNLGEYIPDISDLNGSLLEKYLASTFVEHDHIKLFQDFCGYTLLKKNTHKKALVLLGQGDSGKSTALKLMSLLHDRDNVVSMNLAQVGGFDLSHLPKASLITVGESEDENNKSTLSEGVFKAITGGDKLVIRRKYQSNSNEQIHAPIVIASNKRLEVKDKSGAVFNRLLYLTVHKPQTIIKEIEKRIQKNEMSLLLDWALVGLLRVMNRPSAFYVPKAMQQFNLNERVQGSVLRSFAQEVGLSFIESDQRALSTELWEAINKWFTSANPGMNRIKPANLKEELERLAQENGFTFCEKQKKVNGSSGPLVCNVAVTSAAPSSWKLRPIQAIQTMASQEVDTTEAIVSEYLTKAPKNSVKGKATSSTHEPFPLAA